MEQSVLWYLDDATPHGTARLYVRFPIGAMVPDYEQTVLNEICCWNGPDKNEQFSDGSRMIAWELPKEYVPVVRRFTTVWNNRRNWKEAEFLKVWPQ